jgi:hypothetical protein
MERCSNKANAEFIVTACNAHYDNKRKAEDYPKLVGFTKSYESILTVLNTMNIGGIHRGGEDCDCIRCKDIAEIEALLTKLGEI